MRHMTVEEVQNYLKTNKTIIIPYALCEQHGYHLPLDVDIRNAEFASVRLAEKLGCITGAGSELYFLRRNASRNDQCEAEYVFKPCR